MGKARYLRVLSLREAENNDVAALQRQGVKVIDIFRRGLKEIKKGRKDNGK